MKELLPILIPVGLLVTLSVLVAVSQRRRLDEWKRAAEVLDLRIEGGRSWFWNELGLLGRRIALTGEVDGIRIRVATETNYNLVSGRPGQIRTARRVRPRLYLEADLEGAFPKAFRLQTIGASRRFGESTLNFGDWKSIERIPVGDDIFARTYKVGGVSPSAARESLTPAVQNILNQASRHCADVWIYRDCLRVWPASEDPWSPPDGRGEEFLVEELEALVGCARRLKAAVPESARQVA